MELRHDWTVEQVQQLLAQPFMDLLYQAQTIHRNHQQHNYVQVSTLLSIKTGACQRIANTARKVLTIALTSIKSA
ncbi:biotin synthase [Vibrio ishigakensis]|uniref:Biotin synthase n=1 Tax=Vibrio ishigakensis TaxID=1481914 RepID=A0A0B8QFZ7_9VIBR|nr:biotin synthase [Vibrio ishigakensis]GAM73539.1 biotin synthase [Vibrio ishigakensis]